MLLNIKAIEPINMSRYFEYLSLQEGGDDKICRRVMLFIHLKVEFVYTKQRLL